MEIIRSKANHLIKETKKLHHKKYRTNSYLIEGWHLLEEAQKSGVLIEMIFVSEEYSSRLVDSQNVRIVSSEILQELSDSKSPQGVVARVRLPKETLPSKLSGKYLVLEDIQDPGNVGTMIRTADAAGFDAVFLSDKSADIYSMKVLRSMQGSHYHLPIYRVSLPDLVAFLKKNEVEILATTLSDNSVDYRELRPSKNVALVMGNEGKGISSFIAEEADHLVHIPMKGQAESLNVAIAAGILMFSFI